jgi:hypothetical protein
MMLALQVHVQLGESEENIFVYAVTSNFKEKMILRLLWLVGIMVMVRCSSIYSSIVLL